MLKKTSHEKSLHMAVFGMDDKMFKTMEFAMQKIGKGLATFVHEESSEAAIFNLDNATAPSLLKKYRKNYPENAIVVLSVKDPSLDNCIFVKKPFDMEGLLNAIRAVQKQKLARISSKNSSSMAKVGASSVRIEKKTKAKLSPVTPVIDFQTEKNKDRKFCGTAEDIDLGKSGKSIFYSPEESLQSKLESARQLARQKNNVVIVSIKFEDDLETITLLPRINKVITALDDKKLSYLCSAPLYCLEIKFFRQNAEKSKELEEHAIKSQRSESVDSLFWKVALWTSQGRIPVGSNLNAPVYLKHWPNFTRLHVTPGAFSIAALLHDKPMSLILLVRLLSIPQRYVFAFYSGAMALNLIDTMEVKTEENDVIKKVNHEHPHRRLFGLIMQKLRRAG